MLGSLPLFSSVIPASDFCPQLRSQCRGVGWPGSRPIEAQGRSLDFWPERLCPLCECSKKSTVGAAREPPLRIYSRAWPLHDYFTVSFVFIDIPGSFVTFWRGQTAARKISAQSSTVRLSGFPTKALVGAVRVPSLRTWSKAWPLLDTFTESFVFIDIPGSFVEFCAAYDDGSRPSRKAEPIAGPLDSRFLGNDVVLGGVEELRSGLKPAERSPGCADPLVDSLIARPLDSWPSPRLTLSSRPLDILTLSFVFIDIPGSFVAFWGRQTRSPEDGGPLLDGPTPRPPDQFAARVATRPYADGAKFREQSQNVYENKGKGQEVRESGPRYGGAIGRGLTTFGPSTKMRLGLRALSKMDGFSTLRLAES